MKMLVKICYTDSNETIIFAVQELRRYIELIDKTVEIIILQSKEFAADIKDAIWVGIGDTVGAEFPTVENSELDDAIYIKVDNFRGVIAGTNQRSVLIAVYRFLRELGCAWVRPGIGGEIIPAKAKIHSVSISETASRRHRGVCIEGAVSFSHVLEMIKWLPKVGMNSYFIQFMTPLTFYDRWYAHTGNPNFASEHITVQEVKGITLEHIREIKKRGLLYHAVGHGWTCEPFGIEGNGWDAKEYFVPDNAKKYFALINGKRELFGGIPLDTNLCYSNIEVQQQMTSAIAEYCLKNKSVDYLHFWLADGKNNHCECDACKDTIPADFYVSLLNMLDEKLKSKDISTRIVFLIYCDLLWQPQTQQIKNPDRFVLMFAPISRTYSTAYADADLSESAEIVPYKRNCLKMPREVSTNVAHLKKWQSRFSGDSFIFDYHFMWDHLRDPGGFDIARVVFDDMKNLHKLGLNGMISCQTQRAFFPSGLGMCLMAYALWNNNLNFDDEVNKYFNVAFGDEGYKAAKYLQRLTVLLDSVYIRNEKPVLDGKVAEIYSSVPQFLEDFKETIRDNMSGSKNSCATVRKSWEYLLYHSELCEIISKAFMNKALGNDAEFLKLLKESNDYARLHETELHEVFDVFEFLQVMMP